MMMRMLEQWNSCAHRQSRKADEDNPRGYYEFEAVKKLEQDASWVTEAVNKAVKIIYIFLYRLPSNYKYKVLFLKRNLEDVIAVPEGHASSSTGSRSHDRRAAY